MRLEFTRHDSWCASRKMLLRVVKGRASTMARKTTIQCVPKKKNLRQSWHLLVVLHTTTIIHVDDVLWHDKAYQKHIKWSSRKRYKSQRPGRCGLVDSRLWGVYPRARYSTSCGKARWVTMAGRDNEAFILAPGIHLLAVKRGEWPWRGEMKF